MITTNKVISNFRVQLGAIVPKTPNQSKKDLVEGVSHPFKSNSLLGNLM